MTCSRWDVCGDAPVRKIRHGFCNFSGEGQSYRSASWRGARWSEQCCPSGQKSSPNRDSRKILLLVRDFPPREEIQNGWSRVNSTSKVKINHSITTKLTLGEE